MPAFTFPADCPLISIAMCTYNGERFLREQLDSLIAQDYPNLEIIIIDDRSTDSTMEILGEYENKHDHIRVIQNRTNLGFVKNFEKSISLCSGEYIALCDQDDIWLPHKISTQIKYIGNSDLVYSSVQLIDKNGSRIDREFPTVNPLEGRCHMSLLFTNCVTGHTCLIRRNVFKHALPFPEGIKVHDHWIALVAASLSGLTYFPEFLSLYRQHEQNALLGKCRGTRSRRSHRLQRKFNEKMAFLTATQQLETLDMDEQFLLQKLIDSYSNHIRCFRNRTMQRLIQQNKQLTKVYKKKKQIANLTRGYYANLIR
jgi:glycosyltransferase involved in cell wall biosynthesis